MPSRMVQRSGSATMHQLPRQIKKVSVPIVPDLGIQKCGAYEENISKAMVKGDLHHIVRYLPRERRSGSLRETEAFYLHRNSNGLYLPSTSLSELTVSSTLCSRGDLHSDHTFRRGKKGANGTDVRFHSHGRSDLLLAHIFIDTKWITRKRQ
ncbi:unnamed protein product [Thelazia callipaeda]|uniref:Uncharacterized protein n=1 Tax=Thelazia callipaeda TaxID=103827 RepID=A0A158RC02_THECL|nr:unnamed protein product [Thelazia callipaeda]